MGIYKRQLAEFEELSDKRYRYIADAFRVFCFKFAYGNIFRDENCPENRLALAIAHTSDERLNLESPAQKRTMREWYYRYFLNKVQTQELALKENEKWKNTNAINAANYRTSWRLQAAGKE